MAIKVAIVGFGSEGLAAYNYFKKQGAQITVFDESEQPKQNVPSDVTFIHGQNVFSKLKGYDKIVRFPGINPRRLKTDGEITSNTKEFFRACPTKNIIGVTGTKGKGTICSLIAQILETAGKKVHLAGNIGVPALDIIDKVKADDIVVLELSSYQLWDLEQSPHVAVVGMIEPEHLEVHDGFEDYLNAKANIAKYQSSNDIVIYNPTNQYSKQIAERFAGKMVAYNVRGKSAYATAKKIYAPNGKAICKISEVQVPGGHNIENITAAITAAWQYTQDIVAIAEAVKGFTGLEHRLEFVDSRHGVSFFNDSISTTPGSAIAALKAFPAKKTILIIGGMYDKGADYTGLAKQLATIQPKKVLFIGKMGSKIAEMAMDHGYRKGEVYYEWTLDSITHRALEVAVKGNIVILSPAVASFGDFANYKERGQQFKDIVKGL